MIATANDAMVMGKRDKIIKTIGELYQNQVRFEFFYTQYKHRHTKKNSYTVRDFRFSKGLSSRKYQTNLDFDAIKNLPIRKVSVKIAYLTRKKGD